jgi:hypothetical protein
MKLVYGVGINDLKGDKSRPNGTKCPFYSKWKQMLQRCYSESYLNKRPSYRGCSVCEEWKTFSNFMAWMKKQKHENLELEKDILVPGNKLYSPETCVFVSRWINNALANHGIGIYFHHGKWVSRFEVDGKKVNLGVYVDKDKAHQAYVNYKTKYLKDKIKNLTESDTSDLKKTKQGLLRHLEAGSFFK